MGRSKWRTCMLAALLLGSMAWCGSWGNSAQGAGPAIVTFNPSEAYQEMTGFGAFGLREFNFGDPNEIYRDDWAEQVFADLGLTITRNEWYPAGLPHEVQDSGWDRQKADLQAFHEKARRMGIPLKQLVAVWSPPGEWKTNHSTKRGGHLKSEHYADFAEWLAGCIQSYRDAGIEIYGISPQNEPDWNAMWNSCVYKPGEYVAMIKTVGPILRKRFPGVKIMGPDCCLMDRRARHFDRSIEKALLDDEEALRYLDVWVTHGYSIRLGMAHGYFNLNQTKAYWEELWNRVGPTGKPLWLTELDYFPENWDNSMDVAMYIYAALKYGHVSAWVWWQLGGFKDVPGVDPLMRKGQPTTHYYASKHFFRYIRPGAVRIRCDVRDGEILAVAFKHPADQTLTFVLINPTDEEKQANIQDLSVPLDIIRSSPTERCISAGRIEPGGNVELPPKSIVTLYGRM